MRPRSDVFEYDALEVTTGDAIVILKNIIAVVSKVPKNRQRPRNIGAAITDENRFLDAPQYLALPCYKPCGQAG
jgi:hypothetical protein